MKKQLNRLGVEGCCYIPNNFFITMKSMKIMKGRAVEDNLYEIVPDLQVLHALHGKKQISLHF